MTLLFGTKLLINPNLQLPWSSSIDQDKRFWKLFAILLIPFFILSIGIPLITVPKLSQEEVDEITQTFTQMQIEEEKIEIIPLEPVIEEVPEEKPEEEEVEEEVIEEEKPEEKPEEIKKEPEVVKLEVARQQAKAEINQFANELADLSDMVDLEDVSTTTIDASDSQVEAKQVDRNFITSGAKSKAGGINVSKLSTDTGGGVALQSKKSTKVESKLDDATEVANNARAKEQQDKAFRSDKDIGKKMNAAKGRIDRIYQRALRDDPTLQGTITFEIVIEPNGSVSSAKIISSELNDEKLHRKLLAKIRGINFGASNVLQTTLKYTFEFFPQ